jgi:hypothetical protein
LDWLLLPAQRTVVRETSENANEKKLGPINTGSCIKYPTDPNYELVEWVHPNAIGQGPKWYYRRKLPPELNTHDGVIIRQKVSPVYYKSSWDPFIKEYGSTQGEERRSADIDRRLCNSRGAIYTEATIGYNRKWPQYAYQMIDRHCLNVGYDNSDGGTSFNAQPNNHGDFSKIALPPETFAKSVSTSNGTPDFVVPASTLCPIIEVIVDKNAIGTNGKVRRQTYLTPGGFSCYFCPDIYVWDVEKGESVAKQTILRGNEQDGFVCTRPCPPGFSDNQTGSTLLCIPDAEEAEQKPPLYF